MFPEISSKESCALFLYVRIIAPTSANTEAATVQAVVTGDDRSYTSPFSPPVYQSTGNSLVWRLQK